jgi:hypothetical protein
MFAGLGTVTFIELHFPRSPRNTAADRPPDEHFLESLTFDRLGEVVIHSCFLTFFAVTLDGGCGHGYDRDISGEDIVECMVAEEVGRSVAIYDGHLNIHENDIWFGMRRIVAIDC